MAKQTTKRNIIIGVAAAVAGAAAAMTHPKVRGKVSDLGKEGLDKAKDAKEDMQEKL